MRRKPESIGTLEERRSDLAGQIGLLGDLRRGSLVERYIPCGKPGCHCTQPGSRGHGPCYSLTCKVEGRTKTEYIPKQQVALVREQLDNRRRFAEISKQFLEVNEQLCRLRLEAGQESVAKKNSAKSFRRRSGVRSGG